MSTTRTWKAGRKKLSYEEKQKYLEWSNERTKVANLVNRNRDTIDTSCCICGKEGNILHNKQDPYYISFICKDCRKDENNLIIAEENRFDVRTKLGKANIQIKTFTDQMVVRFVVNYMNTLKSIGDYCEKVGITRYQFNRLVERYDKLFPTQNIKVLVKNRSETIQKQKLRKINEDKKLLE